MKLLLLIVFLLLSVSTHSSDSELALRYLDEKVSNLEQEMRQCAEQAIRKGLPNKEVSEQIKQFEHQQLREFIITRSAYLMAACQKPALSDLAYALVVLEAADVNEEVALNASEIKSLVFGKEFWALKARYEAFPVHVKDQLLEIPYFHTLYQSAELLNHLQLD